MSKRSEKSRDFAKNIRLPGKESNVFSLANFPFAARPFGSQEFFFARAISGKKSPDSLLRGVGGKNTGGGVPPARRRNRKTRRPKIVQGEHISEKEKGRLKERGRSLSVSKGGAPTNGKDPGDSLLKGESRLVGINTKTQKREVKYKVTQQRTLRGLARQAKLRMKNGFWNECKDELNAQMEKAKEQGLNESKAGRYFKSKVSATLVGEKEDAFYLKVKELLVNEGEVSDAIGRLTDREYYDTLSYEEKQRYTLSLSERYLRALERFRRECEFDSISKKA